MCFTLVTVFPKFLKMMRNLSCPAVLGDIGQNFYIKAQLHFDKQSLVQKGPPPLLCDMGLRVANANLLYLQLSLPEFFFTNEAWKDLFRCLLLDCKHSLLVKENQKTKRENEVSVHQLRFVSTKQRVLY